MSFLAWLALIGLGLLIVLVIVATIWNKVDPPTSEWDLHKQAPKDSKKE